MATMFTFDPPLTVSLGNGWQIRATHGCRGPHGLEAIIELVDPEGVIQERNLCPFDALRKRQRAAAQGSRSQEEN
jgi:hypothetical protein